MNVINTSRTEIPKWVAEKIEGSTVYNFSKVVIEEKKRGDFYKSMMSNRPLITTFSSDTGRTYNVFGVKSHLYVSA